MKGAIFTGLAEFVEDQCGLTVWLKAIEASDLPSNGEYLTTELYDDAELVSLLNSLSALTGSSVEQLSRGFGRYFFATLMSLAQKHVEHIDNLFDFLQAVDSIIHIEVQKADPLAYTPTLFYDKPAENVLIVRYMSSRKMCHFAEGLIFGAADHFKQTVKISQSKCICKGDNNCLIRIEI